MPGGPLRRVGIEQDALGPRHTRLPATTDNKRTSRTAVVTMKQLLDSGTQFGHKTRRLNPRERLLSPTCNGITSMKCSRATYLDKAYEFVKSTVAHGGL